jgi:hypothetical protein
MSNPFDQVDVRSKDDLLDEVAELEANVKKWQDLYNDVRDAAEKRNTELSERAQQAEKQVRILKDALAHYADNAGIEGCGPWEAKQALKEFRALSRQDVTKETDLTAGNDSGQAQKALQNVKQATAQDDNTGLGLYSLVSEHMKWDDEKTAHWFDLPNPLLGGVSPNWMLDRGRHDKLGKFIRACLDENKPSESATQERQVRNCNCEGRLVHAHGCASNLAPTSNACEHRWELTNMGVKGGSAYFCIYCRAPKVIHVSSQERKSDE